MNRADRLRMRAGYPVGLLLILLGVLFALAGYRFGFLGFVYGLMLPGVFPRLPVAVLGGAMGVAAFFSPCAFPLLPGYMAYQMGAQAEGGRLRRALFLGLMGALGMVLVNGVIGAVVAAMGQAAPFNPDPRLDPPIVLAPRLLGGLIVAALGAVYLSGRNVTLGPLARLAGLFGVEEPEARRPALETFLYGALYNLIGIGCTGALLLALMAYAFSAGTVWTALTAFGAFSASMGLLMAACTVAAGLSQTALLSRLKGSLSAIRRVSGAFMLVVGSLTVAFVLEGNRLFVQWLFPFLP